MASELGLGPSRQFCVAESQRHTRLEWDCNEKRKDAARKGDAATAAYYCEAMRTHEKWARYYRDKAADCIV